MARVLAVDDDPDVLALLAVTLRQGGYEVDLAAGADDALASMRQQVPDAVLLDVMMPGRDGWSVLEEIKADRQLSEVPVIMVTARGELPDRLRGGVGGALFHVIKPFRPQQLLDVVAEVLGATDPEPVRRRQVQRDSLADLAALESGRSEEGPRPRLSALTRPAPSTTDPWESARSRLGTLSAGQKDLLADLALTGSVASVASQRRVSRSNIYAGLRRIHRKLGTTTVDDLVAVAREGGLAR